MSRLSDDYTPATPSGSYDPLLTDATDATATPVGVLGQILNCTASGATITSPTLPAAVGTPPAKWAVRNSSSGTQTVTYPSDITGSSATITVLAGETITFRQKSTTGWGAESGNKPLSSLDLRFVPSTGTVWTNTAGDVKFVWQPAPDSAAGVGLRIDRTSGAAKFPALTLSVGDVAQWGMAGLDTTVTDGILAYDYLIPQSSGTKSGDVLRVRHGAHFLLGDGIGQPSGAHRLELSSSATDDPATTGALVKTTIATGSPVLDYLRGNYQGVDNVNINRNGFASFGAAYTGWITNGALEAQTGITVVGKSLSPQFQMARTTDINKTYIFDVTSGGSFRIRDNSLSLDLFKADTNGNVALGNGATALATTATNGFANIPVMAGTPTGSPTSMGTGVAQIVLDTTGSKLWARIGGTWKSVALA